MMELIDCRVQANLPAACVHALLKPFPHHSPAKPRIVETIDVRSRVTVVKERIHDRTVLRAILAALRCPICSNLRTRHAPDLLRIGLEELLIEPLAKAIDHPVLEALLLGVWILDTRLHIAQQHASTLDRAKVRQRIPDVDGVLVELAAIIDARQPRYLRSEERRVGKGE